MSSIFNSPNDDKTIDLPFGSYTNCWSFIIIECNQLFVVLLGIELWYIWSVFRRFEAYFQHFYESNIISDNIYEFGLYDWFTLYDTLFI